ncbi:MAG TPA: phage holin family protein [Holophagaceae bacterium]
MRTLLRFLFSALGLLVASAVVPGIRHGAFMDLLAVAVILGLLNATVGALLRFVALVPMVCSFGCFSLVINGLMLWLAGTLSTRLGLSFSVSGFWAGFFGALVTSLVASILGAIFIPKERERPQAPPRIKVIN